MTSKEESAICKKHSWQWMSLELYAPIGYWVCSDCGIMKYAFRDDLIKVANIESKK